MKRKKVEPYQFFYESEIYSNITYSKLGSQNGEEDELQHQQHFESEI